jgi:GNAT superfamily N-acetyltransferase
MNFTPGLYATLASCSGDRFARIGDDMVIALARCDEESDVVLARRAPAGEDWLRYEAARREAAGDLADRPWGLCWEYPVDGTNEPPRLPPGRLFGLNERFVLEHRGYLPPARTAGPASHVVRTLSEPADRPAFDALMDEWDAESEAHAGWRTSDVVARLWNEASTRIYGLSAEGRLNGVALIRRWPDLALIENVYVRRDMRRRGLGRALVRGMVADLRAVDAETPLSLLVEIDHPALLLYATLGFVRVSVLATLVEIRAKQAGLDGSRDTESAQR